MRFWPFWSQREAHPLTFYLREQKRGRRERYKCGSNERDGKTKAKGGGRDLVGHLVVMVGLKQTQCKNSNAFYEV